jgi:hypothetical protein
MGKVITFPYEQPEWEVRFKTPVQLRIGILPFLVVFGDNCSVAKVKADSVYQARYIVSQHLPIDEWLD